MRSSTDFSDRRVAISRVREYDAEQIRQTLETQFAMLGLCADDFTGKKIVLKPNLVNERGPQSAATTHPEVVCAVVRLLKSCGAAEILIAESSSGPYTQEHLLEVYQSSHFFETAQEAGAVFNLDTAEVSVPAPDALVCRRFNIIKPLCDADIIINLCKLKSHGLVKLTCAVKNFFGAIPGRQKMEMHARYAETENFCEMLNDLCMVICQNKPVINICDGIMAMEGNGPGTGDPRWVYAMLTSLNPFVLDLAAADLVDFTDAPMLSRAAARGLCPASPAELEILGEDFEGLRVHDFVPPDSQTGMIRYVKYIPDFVKPHPVIDRSVCVGCGVCARSCPKQTIALKGGKARIIKRSCIRCFCCQELCPHKAVEIKKSRLLELFTNR